MRWIMNTIADFDVTAPPVPIGTPAPVSVRLTVDNKVYKAAGITCLLGKIRNYESLGPLTHISGVPAPFIESQHCVNAETGLPLKPQP